MDNNYIAYHFLVEQKEVGNDILIAELGELSFESFVENENGITAYVQKKLWTSNILDDVNILKSDEFNIEYSTEEIDQVNWNEEWENNFSPINVDGICYIRAPFHQKSDVEFDIVIEPKMSFGTGHHETTHMMIQHLLTMDVRGLKTLDMGCGTAILAILAEMKGAGPIEAIDIDNWCYLNSLENVERNICRNITVHEGDASLLNDQKYDLIIANINRNILLNDMSSYSKVLNVGGTILLSGFYTEDIPAILECCATFGMVLQKQLERNNWASLKLKKQ